MKKVIVLGVATIFLLSSCDSNMGSIYAGGSLGSVLGSAIGGIAGGHEAQILVQLSEWQEEQLPERL